MKFRNFTLMLFLFVFSQANSQVKFIKDTITSEFKVNEECLVYFSVKNFGNSADKVWWKLVKFNINSAWETQVCDNENCYPKNRDICPSGKPNNFNAGETRNWSLHVYPNGRADTCSMMFYLYSDSGFNNKVDSLYFTYEISQTSPTKNISYNRDITIYPNPTSDYFQFNGKPNLGKVEVYNMIGKKIKTYEKSQNNYSIKDLRNGIYLLRVYDSKAQILKVLRLKVNHENP
jgi:hypothetical protein